MSYPHPVLVLFGHRRAAYDVNAALAQGVPAARQKLMARGAWKGILKDDVDLSGCDIKDGQQVTRGENPSARRNIFLLLWNYFGVSYEFVLRTIL